MTYGWANPSHVPPRELALHARRLMSDPDSGGCPLRGQNDPSLEDISMGTRSQTRRYQYQ
jgi:hypothetical protein